MESWSVYSSVSGFFHSPLCLYWYFIFSCWSWLLFHHPFVSFSQLSSPSHPPSKPSTSFRLLKAMGWWTHAGMAPADGCSVSSLIIHSWLFELGPVCTPATPCKCGLIVLEAKWCVWKGMSVYMCERSWSRFLALSWIHPLIWASLFLCPCFSFPQATLNQPILRTSPGSADCRVVKRRLILLSSLILSHQCTPQCWAAHSQAATWPAFLLPLLFALHLHR